MHSPHARISPPCGFARERGSFELNHFYNKVFYSVDNKQPISYTDPIDKYKYYKSLKITKSLIKIRSK